MYDQNTIQLINLIGYFLRKQKKFDAAARVFDALQCFQPEHSYHQLGHGLVCAEQGNFDEAQRRLRRVLASQPGHSFAMACLGLAMLHSGHPGWRDPMVQATQSNDGFGGKNMANEILNMMGPAPRKRQMLPSNSSLGRLKRLGAFMEGGA
jgi:hypothetical protein